MEVLKRKGTAIYDKIIKPFAKASKADAKIHAKILNMELPLEPHDLSTFRINSPISVNLEKKPEKSPSLSNSSSSGEENSQSIQLNNQANQSQDQSSDMQEYSADERQGVLGTPSAERFLIYLENGVGLRKKR